MCLIHQGNEASNLPGERDRMRSSSLFWFDLSGVGIQGREACSRSPLGGAEKVKVRGEASGVERVAVHGDQPRAVQRIAIGRRQPLLPAFGQPGADVQTDAAHQRHPGR